MFLFVPHPPECQRPRHAQHLTRESPHPQGPADSPGGIPPALDPRDPLLRAGPRGDPAHLRPPRAHSGRVQARSFAPRTAALLSSPQIPVPALPCVPGPRGPRGLKPSPHPRLPPKRPGHQACARPQHAVAVSPLSRGSASPRASGPAVPSAPRPLPATRLEPLQRASPEPCPRWGLSLRPPPRKDSPTRCPGSGTPRGCPSRSGCRRRCRSSRRCWTCRCCTCGGSLGTGGPSACHPALQPGRPDALPGLGSAGGDPGPGRAGRHASRGLGPPTPCPGPARTRLAGPGSPGSRVLVWPGGGSGLQRRASEGQGCPRPGRQPTGQCPGECACVWGGSGAPLPPDRAACSQAHGEGGRAETRGRGSQQAMSSSLQWMDGTHRLEEPVSKTTVKHCGGVPMPISP